MTDLELTLLCAEAMGLDVPVNFEGKKDSWGYDPLHDDAQAMALVKKFRLQIEHHKHDVTVWRKESVEYGKTDQELNRAIVECVAKMQAAK